MVVVAAMAAGARAMSVTPPALAETGTADAAAERSIVPRTPTATSDGMPIPILIGGVVLAFAVGLSAGQIHRRRRATVRRRAAAARPLAAVTAPAHPAPAPPPPTPQRRKPAPVALTGVVAPAPPPPEPRSEPPRVVEHPTPPPPPPPEARSEPPRVVEPPAAPVKPPPKPPRKPAERVRPVDDTPPAPEVAPESPAPDAPAAEETKPAEAKPATPRTPRKPATARTPRKPKPTGTTPAPKAKPRSTARRAPAKTTRAAEDTPAATPPRRAKPRPKRPVRAVKAEAPPEPVRLGIDAPLAEAPEVPRIGDATDAVDLTAPLTEAPEALERPEPDSAPALPARRFARATPWPAEAAELWTCEIAWKAGYRKSSFRAMAAAPGADTREPVGGSPAVGWTLMADPEPPTPELAVRVRALMNALESVGWEHIGRGSRWFEQRFLWRGSGSPPPISVPELAKGGEPREG